MISEKEYKVLSFIKNKQRFQTKPYMEEIRTLLAEDFISLCNPTLNGINEYTYQGCFRFQLQLRQSHEIWKIVLLFAFYTGKGYRGNRA